MLEMRPNCELCDRDLDPAAPDVMICTYECTYCYECYETHLKSVCPKCGGNFQKRPIRPRKAWRPERKLGLENHPASTKRVHTPFSLDEIHEFCRKMSDIPIEDR